MKKQEISSAQLMFMAVGSSLVFPYTFMPILNAPPANQDVWIVLLVAFAYILVLNFPFIYFTQKFRGTAAYRVFEIISGKVCGKIFNSIIVLFFIFCFCACSLLMINFIRLFVLPDTPNYVIMLFLIPPAGYAAYKGAGTIGRVSMFIVPLVIISIIIFFILGLNIMELDYLRPLLKDSTFLQINQGAFFTAARYSEILIFFIFTCYLKSKASIIKTYRNSLLLFGVSFMLILLPTLLVLGSQYAKNSWNPYFIYTRQLQSYDFIKRVQSLNILVWFPCSILKTSLYLYMASFMIKGITGIKERKFIVIPLAVIGILVSSARFFNRTIVLLFLTSDQFFPYLITFIVFIIPTVMLIIYLIRRKKIEHEIEKQKHGGSG